MWTIYYSKLYRIPIFLVHLTTEGMWQGYEFQEVHLGCEKFNVVKIQTNVCM